MNQPRGDRQTSDLTSTMTSARSRKGINLGAAADWFIASLPCIIFRGISWGDVASMFYSREKGVVLDCAIDKGKVAVWQGFLGGFAHFNLI